MDRIIKFKLKALLNPGTYKAMVEDRVGSWEISGPNQEEAIIRDSDSDNFPSLRKELTSQGASYDFYQRRNKEADNTTWHHGRNGQPEVYSSLGTADEFTDLAECTV